MSSLALTLIKLNYTTIIINVTNWAQKKKKPIKHWHPLLMKVHHCTVAKFKVSLWPYSEPRPFPRRSSITTQVQALLLNKAKLRFLLSGCFSFSGQQDDIVWIFVPKQDKYNGEMFIEGCDIAYCLIWCVYILADSQQYDGFIEMMMNSLCFFQEWGKPWTAWCFKLRIWGLQKDLWNIVYMCCKICS